MSSGWSVPGVAVALLFSAAAPASPEVDAAYPAAHALYVELHQHPELSGHEVHTAATLAQQLRALGYEVTEHVGGTGVVAILKNGAGPTVMLRTELDALPVEEKTGLPYASKVTALDAAGRAVPVMHACGHDIHMTSWLGAATLLAEAKAQWRYAFFDTMIADGESLPEDYSFCRRWRDIGGEIWIDLDSRFSHVGNYVYKGDLGIALAEAKRQGRFA